MRIIPDPSSHYSDAFWLDTDNLELAASRNEGFREVRVTPKQQYDDAVSEEAAARRRAEAFQEDVQRAQYGDDDPVLEAGDGWLTITETGTSAPFDPRPQPRPIPFWVRWLLRLTGHPA